MNFDKVNLFVTVAKYGLARLVAARHALWRLRRSGSTPSPDRDRQERQQFRPNDGDHHDSDQENSMYVL